MNEKRNDELLKVLDYYRIEYDEKIICPFHSDVNPSLKIDLDENFWYCFGCQRFGNAYDFHKNMQEMKGVTNELEILKLYHKILRKKAVNHDAVVKKATYKKDRKYYRQMYLEAKDYYYNLKKTDWKNLKRKKDRKTREYLAERGFKIKSLYDSGAKLTYKEKTYPVVFPIKDNERFKGWVCRTTSSEIEQKRKYLYNTGFRRNTTLSGTYQKDSVVMIVEGHIDMLKAKQLGVKNVVAILGWKITRKQIAKLKAKNITWVVSALDNDECGAKGTEYLTHFFNVIRFPYPKGIKDMGDMDAEKMRIANRKLNRIVRRLKENGNY